MREFEIVDGSRRKRTPCAVLRYDEAKRAFSVELAEGVGLSDVPMMFEPFVARDQRKVGDEWARRWVRERIVPTGRQNLGEVLRAHGLDEYDELSLLLACEGRCSQDDFYIREAGSDRGELRFEKRAATFGRRVADSRKAANLTQRELAERMGVQQAVVSRLENGRANPTLSLMQSAADALGCALDVSLG